jgi:hypothetical protein
MGKIEIIAQPQGRVSNWTHGLIEQVQLRFNLRRDLHDFRSSSSTASAVETGEGGFWGRTSTINNCINVGTAITQNRSSMSRPLLIVMENGWYHDRGSTGRWLFPSNKANEHFR